MIIDALNWHSWWTCSIELRTWKFALSQHGNPRIFGTYLTQQIRQISTKIVQYWIFTCRYTPNLIQRKASNIWAATPLSPGLSGCQRYNAQYKEVLSAKNDGVGFVWYTNSIRKNNIQLSLVHFGTMEGTPRSLSISMPRWNLGPASAADIWLPATWACNTATWIGGMGARKRCSSSSKDGLISLTSFLKTREFSWYGVEGTEILKVNNSWYLSNFPNIQMDLWWLWNLCAGEPHLFEAQESYLPAVFMRFCDGVFQIPRECRTSMDLNCNGHEVHEYYTHHIAQYPWHMQNNGIQTTESTMAIPSNIISPNKTPVIFSDPSRPRCAAVFLFPHHAMRHAMSMLGAPCSSRELNAESTAVM